MRGVEEVEENKHSEVGGSKGGAQIKNMNQRQQEGMIRLLYLGYERS